MSGSIGSLFQSIMVVDRALPNLLLEHNKTTAKYTLGELRMTGKNDAHFGIYQYVKASEGITRGHVLTEVPWGTWDSSIVVDNSDNIGATDKVVRIDTLTTAMTANEYKGYWIRQAAAAGPLGGAMQIKSHPAIAASSGDGDLTLERATGETIADSKALEIYLPYLMELVDGDIEPIMAVAIADITSDRYGWVQVGGFVPAVEVGDGSSSQAVVLHEPLVPISGNPGATKGMTGGDEADVMEAFCSPLISLDDVGTGVSGFVPAYMKFRG